MEKNKVKFGLSKVYYSKITFGADGSRIFAAPKPLPGAVNLSLEPQGESVKWHADNILYYASATNAGYQGDLEMARITDEFRRDIYMGITDGTRPEELCTRAEVWEMLKRYTEALSGAGEER